MGGGPSAGNEWPSHAPRAHRSPTPYDWFSAKPPGPLPAPYGPSAFATQLLFFSRLRKATPSTWGHFLIWEAASWTVRRFGAESSALTEVLRGKLFTSAEERRTMTGKTVLLWSLPCTLCLRKCRGCATGPEEAGAGSCLKTAQGLPLSSALEIADIGTRPQELSREDAARLLPLV